MARILVIDDEPDVRLVIQEALASAGHEVVVAANGVEGLRAQHALPAQIALVDLFMPEKEGVETIQDFRRQFPEVKLIAMSGGGRSLDGGFYLSAVSQLGASAVLRKPFDCAALLGVIERLLGDPSEPDAPP